MTEEKHSFICGNGMRQLSRAAGGYGKNIMTCQEKLDKIYTLIAATKIFLKRDGKGSQYLDIAQMIASQSDESLRTEEVRIEEEYQWALSVIEMDALTTPRPRL